MDRSVRTTVSLLRAHDALLCAAADLATAVACAEPGERLRTDAGVLADAVEREAAALAALLERHA